MTETTMNEELSVSADKESEAQLNRLAIRIDIPTEGEYKEMEAVQIENLQKFNTDEFTDVQKLCKIFVEWDLLKTLPKSPQILSFDMEMKMIISRLRYEQAFKKASKGEFAKCIHKYLKSKKTEETTEFQMLQIAKIAKKVQALERKEGINCSKFMRPFTAEIIGYSACTEILFNEKRCKDILSKTIKECNEKVLSFIEYNQVESIWKKWSETIFVQKKPLEKHRLMLENAFDAIKQNYQADKAISDLKELIEGATKEEKEEIKRMEKESETNVEFIIKASKSKLRKKLNFIGAKILFAFIEGRLLTEACKALTNSLKLIIEAQSSAKDLIECEYKFEYSDVTQKWLQLLHQEKEGFQSDFDLIIECGAASAAGRSLIAYETKTNLRIYASEQMIENHYPEAKHVHHISLDPKSGALQLLAFNTNHVELCDYRENFGITFRQRLIRYEEHDFGIKGANLIDAINTYQ
uniref:Uncharacterized protein n=1 Tax=Panagrolaimus superbus TaxID=310955 RepID=A0A914Z2H1_9BILA